MEQILTAHSGMLGGKSTAATRAAPATAKKRVDFIVNCCGQENKDEAVVESDIGVVASGNVDLWVAEWLRLRMVSDGKKESWLWEERFWRKGGRSDGFLVEKT